MRVLVTGGCGFIGVNLVQRLFADGIRYVRVVDNLSVGKAEFLESVFVGAGGFTKEEGDWIRYQLPALKAECELIVGDILDSDLATSACSGMDVVVHLAANTGVLPSIEDPRTDCEVNVIGTFNYLEGSRSAGVGRFVFASSNAPLGSQDPPVNEGKVPKPIFPYGASKLAGEGYCFAYHGSFGLNSVILRFGNVYGPCSGHKESIVAKFFKRALAGQPLEIYGSGTQTRDFIYIEDLVQAIIKAINAEVAGEVFQISTHKETTVNEIAEKIKALVERDTELEVEVVNTAPNKGEIQRCCSDINKARRMLGFEPRYDIEKGLEECWQWFKGQEEAGSRGDG